MMTPGRPGMLSVISPGESGLMKTDRRVSEHAISDDVSLISPGIDTAGNPRIILISDGDQTPGD